MNTIKEFLKPQDIEDKQQAKRIVKKTYLFGFAFVFLIGFIGGTYVFKSILYGLMVAGIVSFPFLVGAILTMPISLFGIEKGWGKKDWRMFSIVLILVGLLILLLGNLFF